MGMRFTGRGYASAKMIGSVFIDQDHARCNDPRTDTPIQTSAPSSASARLPTRPVFCFVSDDGLSLFAYRFSRVPVNDPFCVADDDVVYPAARVRIITDTTEHAVIAYPAAPAPQITMFKSSNCFFVTLQALGVRQEPLLPCRAGHHA